jgi:hypothetical protein
MDPITIGIFAIMVTMGMLMLRNFKPVPIFVLQGTALVRQRLHFLPDGGLKVFFSTNYILRFADRTQKLDITLKALRYSFEGKTADGKEFTLEGEIILQIPAEPEAALRVVDTIGVDKANDLVALKDHFGPRFLEATRAVTSTLTVDDLRLKRELIGERWLEHSGEDWDGFEVYDLSFIQLKRKES